MGLYPFIYSIHFLTFIAEDFLDRFDRPAALTSVASMRSFGVVADESGIEIGPWRVDRFAEGLAHFHPEELLEDGTVAALDEAIRAGDKRFGNQPADFRIVPSPSNRAAVMLAGTRSTQPFSLAIFSVMPVSGSVAPSVATRSATYGGNGRSASNRTGFSLLQDPADLLFIEPTALHEPSSLQTLNGGLSSSQWPGLRGKLISKKGLLKRPNRLGTSSVSTRQTQRTSPRGPIGAPTSHQAMFLWKWPARTVSPLRRSARAIVRTGNLSALTWKIAIRRIVTLLCVQYEGRPR